MRPRRIIKGTFKIFLDFPSWMGWGQIRSSSGTIGSWIKEVYTPAKASREETFEEAIKRLELTPEDIQRRVRGFRLFLVVFLVFAIVVLAYAVNLFTDASFHGGLACLALVFLSLAQAFRYHFWLTQIKLKRLGMTLKDWLNYITGR